MMQFYLKKKKKSGKKENTKGKKNMSGSPETIPQSMLWARQCDTASSNISRRCILKESRMLEYSKEMQADI